MSCLRRKWRKRSFVKITERTHEETTEALHAGREGHHSSEAFGGRSVPPAGRVTDETDYFRLAGDPPRIGPVALPIKVQTVFAESHAAAIKHTVIRVAKTMGVVKAYSQHKAVTATKQTASAHAMLRTRAKVSAGSPPSSHTNTAANKRNTEKKNPNALKKSQ